MEVDITPPIINSILSDVQGRRVNIILDVTEENLDEIVYIDNSESRPRERILCTRLREDICEKRLSFREGVHYLTIIIRDEAGNSVAQDLRIVV